MNEQLIKWVLEFQDGDIKSRDKVIEYFYPRIISKAKQMGGKDFSGDLAGFGTLRLIVCMEKFDIKKTNGNFLSYAWSYIYYGMDSYLGRYKSPITMPGIIHSDVSFAEKASNRFLNKYGRDPSKSELRCMLGWSDSKFEYVSRLIGGGFSYDNISLRNYTSKTTMIDDINNKMIANNIHKYVSYLTGIEKKIFYDRMKGVVLKKTGDELGITRERVRQIYKRVLSKIKNGLGNMKLEPQT